MVVTETETIKLVKKAPKGDDGAYLELFVKYEEMIYRTAYLYVKNEEDALDVVQETAYRSFKSIKNLKKPKYFKTWLTRIAITSALDVLRKRKNMVFIDEYKEDMASVEDETAEITTSVSLLELLKSLKDDEKSVVILKYYYDYTFNMISEILDMPLGSVKTIIYRALKKLRIEGKENLYE
ncbi:RNA polymerase sigma-70 factor, ECF subfamily [Lutispora thermophila DSM 19022]|uniref:RNA polymerase sigma-70 factor, ECF subfamily n=2 Tax=Lutispora TaxID=667112 RepID=A0A1M6HDH7_9FIRM|nr:RNA polymerase sigma-70 factor, ECF subfamily [Lutispora thermophila DSM 19022]